MKRLAALAAFKLSLFLKNRVDNTLFQRYSRLISEDITEAELAEYPEATTQLFFDQSVMAARYQILYDHCQGDPIALTAIQLYLLAQMDERTLPWIRLVCRSEFLLQKVPARIAKRLSTLLRE